MKSIFLHKKKTTERDCVIHGKAYVYKLWIFYIRLNPTKLLTIYPKGETKKHRKIFIKGWRNNNKAL